MPPETGGRFFKLDESSLIGKFQKESFLLYVFRYHPVLATRQDQRDIGTIRVLKI